MGSIMASVIQRGRSWRAHIFCRGVRDWRTFDSREEAAAWSDAREAEIRATVPRQQARRPSAVIPPAGYIPLTRAKVAAGATPIRLCCGVYFLLSKGEIVYVGKSNNIHRRIGAHIGVIEFDAGAIEECDQTKAGVLESLYLAKFLPKHNRVGFKVIREPFELPI